MDPTSLYINHQKIVNHKDYTRTKDKIDFRGSKFVSKINTIDKNSKDNFKTIYVDKELFNKRDEVKDQFPNKDVKLAKDSDKTLLVYLREEANEYEDLKRNIFSTRAAVKLANIDAVFKITYKNNERSYEEPTNKNSEKLVFCDLAGGPGSWIEYLQYTSEFATIFGITLNEHTQLTLNWKLDKLKHPENVKILWGKDGDGNLYNSAEYIEKPIFDKTKSKCDLVTSDGGIEIGDDFKRQELLNSRLFLSEVYSALNILKDGGNFVLKVYDLVSNFSCQLVFLLNCCFDQISIFKPVSSRPANQERYVVCLGYEYNQNIIDIVKTAYDSYTDNIYLRNMFDSTKIKQSVLKEFAQWLIEVNNIHVQQQYETSKRMVDIMNKKYTKKKKNINFSKCLILWNLPDVGIKNLVNLNV